MARATVFVTDKSMLAGFVEFYGQLRDLARNGHRVDIRSGDVEAVDDVPARHVERDLVVRRYFDRIGLKDERLGDDVGRVFVFTDLFDSWLTELFVIIEFVRRDRLFFIADHRDAEPD